MSLVLVIDDSKAMRMILGKHLKEWGFDVVQAANGQEGLEQLERHQDEIDLILVDWNMPVMNGYEFVQAARKVDQYRDKKIVMVTSETEPGKMVKALMAGLDEFVMKPFTAEILSDKLRLIGVQLPTFVNSLN